MASANPSVEAVASSGCSKGGYASRSAAGRGSQLKESMKQLLQSKAAKPAKAAPEPSIPRPVAEKQSPRPDPVLRNQEFFNKMEKEYGALFKAEDDGWDAILRESKEMSASGSKASGASGEIPADSDYYRVKGADREVRCDPDRARQLLEEASKVHARPRRNLDNLRRVEAETREAIEKEKQRIASMPKSEPIRTKSEVVHIDSLSDSEDEAKAPKGLNAVLRDGLAELEQELANRPAVPKKKKGKVNLDSISDDEAEDQASEEQDQVKEDDEAELAKKRESALAAMHALEEFDRLGREKEQLLAKYRDKYG